MARINYRLSEWLKRADKKEAEYISRKTHGNQEEPAETPEQTNDAAETEVTSQVATPVTAKTSSTSVRVIPNPNPSTVTPKPKAAPAAEHKASSPKQVTTPVVEKKSPNNGHNPEVKLKLTPEGTGDPRPMAAKAPAVAIPEAKPIEELLEQDEIIENPKPAVKAIPEPKEPAIDIAGIQESWSRLPHHLQVLFSTPKDEVAQRSYKTFKDTREQLIERLLDPPLTLEDTARILNVCPTTVRRYTNRNQLKHFRTAGNQRRFRLSDVLSFMESNSKNTNKVTDKRKTRGEE